LNLHLKKIKRRARRFRKKTERKRKRSSPSAAESIKGEKGRARSPLAIKENLDHERLPPCMLPPGIKRATVEFGHHELRERDRERTGKKKDSMNGVDYPAGKGEGIRLTGPNGLEKGKKTRAESRSLVSLIKKRQKAGERTSWPERAKRAERAALTLNVRNMGGGGGSTFLRLGLKKSKGVFKASIPRRRPGFLYTHAIGGKKKRTQRERSLLAHGETER